MKSGKATLVLGGGLAGLAAARALEAAGEDCRLIERCPALGGLTRTVQIGDFCFDYTGHFLHLSQFRSPADIPFAGQRDSDWQQIERRSACFVAGALVPAPIQYHLGDLPDDARQRCIESYERRPQASPVTFRDFIVSGFGEALAELFLIPQNEKTMAIALDRLSQDAVRRFFPAPDDDLIRRGFTAGSEHAAGYNAQFWYPRAGGIGRLVAGFAAGLRGQPLHDEVVAIDLDHRTVHTRSGHRLTWDRLLPSLPLKRLCEMAGDAELRALAQRLSHSATISFNIGLRGALPGPLRELHWVYVPDRALPFYRVGSYSAISAGTTTAGRSSLYVEVGVAGEALAGTDIAGDLQPRVLAALGKLGWVEPRDIDTLAVHVIECAYVHHTPDRDASVAAIRHRLERHGVFPIGRYGQWDYTSMEDSIRCGIAAAGNP